MPEIPVYDTDILIVGSAGAGLRSAIEASRSARVTILSKGPFGRGGATVMAGADIKLDGKSLHELGFPGDPEDSKEKFFNDILNEGFELNNQEMVEAYVEKAPARVQELLTWEMKIDPERLYRRAIITTGSAILQALRRRLKNTGVKIREHFMATDLLTREGVICGALGVDTRSGEVAVFKANAVILATGGWHELFSFNSGSEELTGDGPAMALRAGVSLSNMEMITFCPNIILHPPAYRGSVLLYNFLNGKLLNAKGDEFLLWEDPSVLEIAQTSEWNKLIFSRASWLQIASGQATPHGGVYYSLRHLPPEIWEQMAENRRWKNGWKFQGKDFTFIIDLLKSGRAIEVAPAAHYFEGGIKVNAQCETNLPGLFAAGECTGELFGANRVSAATTEMLVHGAIAGKSALSYIVRTGKRSLEPEPDQIGRLEEELTRPLRRNTGIRASEVKSVLQKTAYETLGPIRDRKGLERASAETKRLEKAIEDIRVPPRRIKNRAWLDAIEVRNLVPLFRASALSALAREESRGVHSRKDFPNVDNHNWLKNCVIRAIEGGFELAREEIVRTSVSPDPIVLSYEDAIRRAIERVGGT